MPNGLINVTKVTMKTLLSIHGILLLPLN